ncbi:DUF2235 domain-containing protein [Sphingomonas oryzagri]
MSVPPRNLVLLCDGTSNEVKQDLTNVLKLYRIAARNEEQRVFYDPGIGTIGLDNDWGHTRQALASLFGLATGWGLDDNILDAYAFLCREWRAGDRIYLFGFSRGAYTARAVAGLVYLLGILRPEQLNLVSYALTAYKRSASEHSLEIAWQFQRVIGGRRAPIHFLGVWDTVASVIVPRRDRLYLPGLAFLPYTRQNPAVRTFRQAAAIDERRSLFRLYRWDENQRFEPEPFSLAGPPQDARTVWFVGDHSDVGGGYPESESQVAKFPLAWMVREAQAQGLRIDRAMFEHLALGAPMQGGRQHYVAPDAQGPAHNSMKSFWPLFEIVPKRVKWRRWPEAAKGWGVYLPLSEPRRIEPGAWLHRSVAMRIEAGYRPVNLPPDHRVADDLPDPGEPE